MESISRPPEIWRNIRSAGKKGEAGIFCGVVAALVSTWADSRCTLPTPVFRWHICPVLCSRCNQQHPSCLLKGEALYLRTQQQPMSSTLGCTATTQASSCCCSLLAVQVRGFACVFGSDSQRWSVWDCWSCSWQKLH